MKTFDANDLFDMAIRLEQDAAAFYSIAAEHASGAVVGKELLALAEMEKAHEVEFAELKEAVLGTQATALSCAPDSAAGRYLGAVAEGHVFNLSADASQALSEMSGTKDILEFALERERDAVVFYTAMQAAVPKKLGSEKIESIVLQEMGHVALLSTKLSEL